MIWLLLLVFSLGISVGFIIALWQISRVLESGNRNIHLERFNDHD